jgi:cytochrome c553
MIKVVAITSFMLTLSGIAWAAEDQQPDVGADLAKAAECKECHGPDGIDLGGEKQTALVEKMKAIRSGDTDHMPVLDGVSDADLNEIAKILAKSD